MSGVFTAGDVRLWIQEADPALRGAYVHRVWRTETTWVVLARHHEGGDPSARAVGRVALEVALDGDWARCVATTPEWVSADDKQLKKVASKDAHPFLSLLRKQLVGCRVLGVAQLGDDRVAQLRCELPAQPPPEHEPEPGPRLRLLTVELIGRVGNLVLLAQGEEHEPPRVVRTLHAGRARRPLTPGDVYEPPPPRPGGAEAAPSLVTDVLPDPASLALGLAVAAVQREVETASAQTGRKDTLLKAARKAIERGEGVLRKLEAQLSELARADEMERLGDLLKAHLPQLPRQAERVTLTDYSSGEAVSLELRLDPTKTVQQAMKGYYKQARKLRSGEVHVRTRQGELDEQLGQLRAVLEELEGHDPADEEALEGCAQRLRRLHALPQDKPKGHKQQVNQGPRSFRTREGHEILVGRSDEENDRLTMRTARGNDLFFHVAGCPGSHVILRVDIHRPPNHESLLDAASVAAYYSKARGRGVVDVHYTPRKWVSKPRGAKPGLVHISNHKMVRASGAGERIQRVLATARRAEEDDDAQA